MLDPADFPLWMMPDRRPWLRSWPRWRTPVRDAAGAGTPADAVNAAVGEVAAGYVDAQVSRFIGVLVEREVRTRLQLRPDLPVDE